MKQPSILTPLVGYGFCEATGEYRLNADEEHFERRRSSSSWWRAQMEKAAAEAPAEPVREPQLGPPTWTITEPAEAAGEQFHDHAALMARTNALHRAGHRTIGYRNNP